MTPPKKTLHDALMALDAKLDAPRLAAQSRRLRAAVPVRRSSLATWTGVATASTLALLAGWIVWHGSSNPAHKVSTPVGDAVAITSAPTEREETKGTTEQAPPRTPLLRRITLSQGVSMDLGEHTKARARRVGPRAFEVLLEDGKVDLPAAPRSITRAAWVVLAGEYRVKAREASFSVSYEAISRAMQVHVSTGQVVVSGPGTPTQTLQAGQDLLASATLKSSRVPQKQTRAQAPSHGQENQDWHVLYQAGRYADALAAARAAGLSAANHKSLDASDLTDLADAARLARAPTEARGLLHALRTRYPDSPGARDGAFLLGRLSSETGSAAEAQSWFATYLRESPSGTYAQESLGRLLTLAAREPESARARGLAQTYLSKFPGGPYAALARSLSH